MQTTKHRVQNYRNRLRNAGLKPVQLWLPDTQAPGFAAECRRQSLLIANDDADIADLEIFSEIADWGTE